VVLSSPCLSFLNVFIRNLNYKGINPLITPKDKKHKKDKNQLRKGKPSSVGKPLYNPPKRQQPTLKEKTENAKDY